MPLIPDKIEKIKCDVCGETLSIEENRVYYEICNVEAPCYCLVAKELLELRKLKTDVAVAVKELREQGYCRYCFRALSKEGFKCVATESGFHSFIVPLDDFEKVFGSLENKEAKKMMEDANEQ